MLPVLRNGGNASRHTCDCLRALPEVLRVRFHLDHPRAGRRSARL